MFNIQCDKNLIKDIECFLKKLNINAIVSLYDDVPSDICILRNNEYIPENSIIKSKYLIINSDDEDILESIKTADGKIITCGMATRATVTLSSISEKNGVVCIQRSINTLNSKKISPLEIPFELGGKMIDEISILVLITTAILCDADVEFFRKIYI